MENIKYLLLVILAVVFGSLFLIKRLAKKNKLKPFNYQPRYNKEQKIKKDIPFSERVSFRKNNPKPIEEKPQGIVQSFKKASLDGQNINNVELNKTFWIALIVLVFLVFAFFEFDLSFFIP